MAFVTKNTLLFILILGYSNAKECPDMWTVYGTSCYLFGHQKLPFFSAESYCRQHKSHLVYINDATENSFIREHLRNLKGTNWWIGLSDDDTENTWIWYGMNEMTEYTDWAPGQPDDYGNDEDCVEFDMRPGYKEHWNDATCSDLFPPICERPSVNICRFDDSSSTIFG